MKRVNIFYVFFLCMFLLLLRVDVFAQDTQNRLTTTLIDETTEAYYNDKLGKILDAQKQFPEADSSKGDPSILRAKEPNLDSITDNLGDWLSPIPYLGNNWTYGVIPSTWATNTETAVVYQFYIEPGKDVRLTGKFAVDNGIFVWVNGKFKFGAIEPGAVNGFEYNDIDLGEVQPGMNYIQILREDHGEATGYMIHISGTVVESPSN